MNLAILSTFLVSIVQLGSPPLFSNVVTTGSEQILTRLEQVDVSQYVSCYDLNPNNSVYLVNTESAKFGSTQEVLYFNAPCRSEIAPMVGYLALSLARPDRHINNVEWVLKTLASKNGDAKSSLDSLLNAPGDTGNFSLLDFLENKLDTGGLCNECKSATVRLMGLLKSYGAHTRLERIQLNQSKWDE